MRGRFQAARLAGACAVALLALSTCTMPGVPSSTQWTITGTAQFTLTAAPAQPISLAAFYYKLGVGTPNSPAPISNIVSLGSAASTPTSFTLNINASTIAPAAGDSIVIQMWDDANLNGQMDLPGESNAYAQTDAGDQVFPTTSACQFVFSGVAWYLGAATIQSAAETGAVIRSVTPLN
ncbi:MAG TPA: hypothetical protein VMV03_01600 [Spirochaetia bacterium]|nr:hypothetical protein [Spirochaetia bacterium]